MIEQLTEREKARLALDVAGVLTREVRSIDESVTPEESAEARIRLAMLFISHLLDEKHEPAMVRRNDEGDIEKVFRFRVVDGKLKEDIIDL